MELDLRIFIIIIVITIFPRIRVGEQAVSAKKGGAYFQSAKDVWAWAKSKQGGVM